MIIFREHPIFFLGLKYVQLLFSILVIVFEITQYVTYGNNSISPGQYNDWFDKADKEGDSNGEFKIWLLVVCSLTILNLVYNLVSFKKHWEKGFSVWVEIIFAVLWLSAGLSNLDPVFKGTNDLNCKSHSMENDPPKKFICNVWVTSLIFGWLIFGTYLITAFISWQLIKETKEKTKWIKRSYPRDSYNSNKSNDRKSFYVSSVPQPIITIQNNSSDELEKGGVPELLLQSGLPADHRMSLKVVLPQSGPFSQSNDSSSNQHNQHNHHQQQKQDEIGDNLAFPLPPTKLVNGSTLTLPDITDVEQNETFNPNQLIIPSKKSAEVSSLHEVPL
ncbi:unnamed protein product [Rhizophagus irregularis]|uniref:MARVEL domain-containing protein n=2 Tax=Rhizophagus irregularis TaxID=588596 RepID=A0A915Z4E7_9GLOM|nr:unnamed protein product [Rhizophagus irregularis]CAB5360430.1 unnamed protein product [Rhizophagus irregularis]